jgi:peptidoglycan/xylan/chitin deacetylase (PgdA/CDA1 family)
VLKRVAKTSLGTVARSPLLRQTTARLLSNRLNIVYYHDIGPLKPFTADFFKGATLERLDRDLEILARRFEFASLWDVVDGRRRGPGVDRRPLLAVTFDDGFDLIGSGAADVLERHGVRATSFVITGCVDNKHLMWRNKLSWIRSTRREEQYIAAYNEIAADNGGPPITSGKALLAVSRQWPMSQKDELADALWQRCAMPSLGSLLDDERPYFSSQRLEEWLARGHSIGLHTASHPFCSSLQDEQIQDEIVLPADKLRERFGLERVPFSYPFGPRLPEDTEAALVRDGVVDCMLGIEGFSPRNAPLHHLERACVDAGVSYAVFAVPLRQLATR